MRIWKILFVVLMVILTTGFAQTQLTLLKDQPLRSNSTYASDIAFSNSGTLFITSFELLTWEKNKPVKLGSFDNLELNAFILRKAKTPFVVFAVSNPKYRLMSAEWDGKKWVSRGDVLKAVNVDSSPSRGDGQLLESKDGSLYYTMIVERMCPPASCSRLIVSKYDGKTWQTLPEIKSGLPRIRNTTAWRASALDNNNKLFVVAETKIKNFDPDSVFEVERASEFGIYQFDGKKWTSTGRFPSSEKTGISLARDSQGRIHLLRTFENQLILSRWNGRTWQQLGKTTFGRNDLFGDDDLSMVIDSQGNTIIGLIAGQTKASVIVRRANGTWKTTPRSSTWVRVALDRGKPKIVSSDGTRVVIEDASKYLGSSQSAVPAATKPVATTPKPLTAPVNSNATKTINFWVGTWYSIVKRDELRIEKQQNSLLIFNSNQAFDGFISESGTLIIKSPFGNLTGNYDSSTEYLFVNGSLFTKNRALAARIHLEKTKTYANALLLKFLSDTARGIVKSIGKTWGKDSCFDIVEAPGSVARCGYSVNMTLHSITVSITPYLGNPFSVDDTSLLGFGKTLSLQRFQGNFSIGRGTVIQKYYLQLYGEEKNGSIGNFITESSPYGYYAICTYSLRITSRLSNAIVVETKLAQAAETGNSGCSTEVISFRLLWDSANNQLHTTYSYGINICSFECGNYSLTPSNYLPDVKNPIVAVQVTFPPPQNNSASNTPSNPQNTQQPTDSTTKPKILSEFELDLYFAVDKFRIYINDTLAGETRNETKTFALANFLKVGNNSLRFVSENSGGSYVGYGFSLHVDDKQVYRADCYTERGSACLSQWKPDGSAGIVHDQTLTVILEPDGVIRVDDSQAKAALVSLGRNDGTWDYEASGYKGRLTINPNAEVGQVAAELLSNFSDGTECYGEWTREANQGDSLVFLERMVRGRCFDQGRFRIRYNPKNDTLTKDWYKKEGEDWEHQETVAFKRVIVAPTIDRFEITPSRGVAPLKVTTTWAITNGAGSPLECEVIITNAAQRFKTDCNANSFTGSFEREGSYTITLSVQFGNQIISRNATVIVDAPSDQRQVLGLPSGATIDALKLTFDRVGRAVGIFQIGSQVFMTRFENGAWRSLTSVLRLSKEEYLDRMDLMFDANGFPLLANYSYSMDSFVGSVRVYRWVGNRWVVLGKDIGGEGSPKGGYSPKLHLDRKGNVFITLDYFLSRNVASYFSSWSVLALVNNTWRKLGGNLAEVSVEENSKEALSSGGVLTFDSKNVPIATTINGTTVQSRSWNGKAWQTIKGSSLVVKNFAGFHQDNNGTPLYVVQDYSNLETTFPVTPIAARRWNGSNWASLGTISSGGFYLLNMVFDSQNMPIAILKNETTLTARILATQQWRTIGNFALDGLETSSQFKIVNNRILALGTNSNSAILQLLNLP
jgi:hypothetical protein